MEEKLTSGSMLAAFVLLGYFNGLCGFRIVANRLPSDGVTLFTSNTSGRSSDFPSTATAPPPVAPGEGNDVDIFRLLFIGAKKYFGFSVVEDAADSFSFE